MISNVTLTNEDFDWVKHLDDIAESFNSTVSKGTNYSPNQIEEFYNKKDLDKIAEIYQEQVAIKSKSNKLAKQE